MNGWHVRRREYGGIFSRCANARSPAECLETLPIKIRSATETAPTCNWNDRLKFHSVRTLSQRKSATPNCGHRPVNLGYGATTAEIRAECSQSKHAIIE